MTSNTAPYGEAIASSEYVASAGKLEAYQPFAKRDRNNVGVGGSQWASAKNSGIGEYIGYDFKKSVVVKQLYYAMRSDTSLLNDCDVVLEGFDGVSWNSIIKFTLKAKTEELIAFSNNQPYSKYRLIYEGTNYASDNNCQVFGLQFYGVDYSEREFAEGSTMKYIYDHGVKLEELTSVGYDSELEPTYESNQMYFSPTNESKHRYAGLVNAINLTPYLILRASIGDKATIANSSYGFMMLAKTKANSVNSGTSSAYKKISSISNPENDLYIDISAISDNEFISISSGYQTRSLTIKEWWLE